MRKPIANEWRNEGAFICFIVMLLSVFVSRALLSITMIVFLAVCLLHRNFFRQFVWWGRNFFLVGITLLFLIPFLSFFWSDDVKEWSEVVRIKLPLLVFPVAFAGTWQLKEKRWVQLMLLFLLLVFLGVCWSLYHYVQDMRSIHEGYLRSQTIVTILENDHVRFSWMVTIGVLIAALLMHLYERKAIRMALAVLILYFAIYLHILSARTGLVSFYMVVIIYLVWLLVRQKKFFVTLTGIGLLVALPLLSWWLLPTFQNRIRYFLYDLSYIRSDTYLPGANDGNRYFSLRAGWDIILHHPFGVGAGDIKTAAALWYDQHTPDIRPVDRLYPHSEWLVYGCTAGWPGMIGFTIAMLVPFFVRPVRYRVLWIGLNATAAFSFLFDIGLEGQYALFLYCFIVFSWWKWLHAAQVPSTSR